MVFGAFGYAADAHCFDEVTERLFHLHGAGRQMGVDAIRPGGFQVMNNDDILKRSADGSAEVPPGPRCGGCGDTTLTIHFILDGDKFSMQSCTGCDHRTWRRAGDDVGLDGVLADLTSCTTRFRRDLATR